jgi:hypothetical protein
MAVISVFQPLIIAIHVVLWDVHSSNLKFDEKMLFFDCVATSVLTEHRDGVRPMDSLKGLSSENYSKRGPKWH